MSPIAWLTITFFGALVIGVPVYVTLGLAGVVAILAGARISLEYIPQAIYGGLDNFPIIAIPCFVLAGSIMEHSGMTRDIVTVFDKLIGGMRGSLGIVTILACTFFAAISGSGPGTVAAIGSIMIPAMVWQKYPINYASGIACTGGDLGVMIPPSNPMIIFGVMAQSSITALFIGGIVPGLMMAVGFIGLAYLFAVKEKIPVTEAKFNLKESLKAIWKGKFALCTPILILGGIYSGIFTPVEASVVAVVYALLVAVFVQGNFGVRQLIESLRKSHNISGVLMIIIGTSTLFGRLLTMYRVPNLMVSTLTGISTNPVVILWILLGIFIVLGMFMETLSTIIIVTPLLLPLTNALGIDPLVFGIFFVATNTVAFTTPPLGVNLFVAARLSGLSVERVFVNVFPYIMVEIGVIILIIYFPGIVTFLPRLMGF